MLLVVLVVVYLAPGLHIEYRLTAAGPQYVIVMPSK
jgi:hypothetical protein